MNIINDTDRLWEVRADKNAPCYGLIHFMVLILAIFGTFSAPLLFSDAQTFTTLYNCNETNLYGFGPQAGLTPSGNILYGAVGYGGANGSGVIVAVDTLSNSITVLHAFAPSTGFIENFYNTDGAFPESPVVLANDKIYGTTQTGGTNGWGTIFSMNTNGDAFTNLYIFTGSNDGGYPKGLTLSRNILYGVADMGGSNGCGTIFSINPDGSDFRVLKSFSAYKYNGFGGLTNQDGSLPVATLLAVGDTLYGTTVAGGTNGSGTFFSIHTDGTGFTVLHAFGFSDGRGSTGSLLLSDIRGFSWLTRMENGEAFEWKA